MNMAYGRAIAIAMQISCPRCKSRLMPDVGLGMKCTNCDSVFTEAELFGGPIKQENEDHAAEEGQIQEDHLQEHP